MGKSKNRKMEFKRFTVHDDRCAMKIGTDAVLLGTLSDHPNPQRIVDVGTGCGIVALMLAQRFPKAFVDAVELNPEAASQAIENFSCSPFSDRLTCIQSSFQDWASSCSDKYDLIVCNPPYYDGTSKSPDEARNMARHQDHLPIQEFLQGAMSLLNEGGRVVVVWPVNREEEFVDACGHSGLTYNGSHKVKATEDHQPIRLIAVCSKSVKKYLDNTLTLESGVGYNREFTPEYLELVREFFLKA